jgi:hypothetical protein
MKPQAGKIFRKPKAHAGSSTKGNQATHWRDRVLYSFVFFKSSWSVFGSVIRWAVLYTETDVTEISNLPKPRNLIGTTILDIHDDEIRSLAAALSQSNLSRLQFLQKAHLHLVQSLQPVYSVNEEQPASVTLRKGSGSCSQRTAVLEAIARAAGIPTRVHALAVNGSFWYPRFRFTRPFIPKSVLLVWPQFYVGDKWQDFDELHAPIEQIAARAKGGFTNTGESLFEAVESKPVDFLGKTCGLGCYSPERDLSKFLLNNHGLFDTRDEVFEQFGSFQHTLRGRAFELIFGNQKSF